MSGKPTFLIDLKLANFQLRHDRADTLQ